MNELLPGIWTWPWFSERHGYDFNGWLVVAPDGNLVIDPVEMPPAVLDRLVKEGVSTIVLTNRNHYRDAARLREATGARVAVHPADAELVRQKGVPVDAELRPGQRLGPFTILDASGKSPGEVALYWPERRLLVVGDICVGKPPGGLALLPETVMDDPAALKRSLRRLAGEVDCEAVLVGDGAPILSGGQAALLALLATF